MDNEIFRDTYRAINERFCAYEKGILTNQCRCSQAERFCIAEREGVHCRSDQAQIQCLELLDLLRQQARFTLKASDRRSTLPHAQAMRIQIGGLRGIHRALDPSVPVPPLITDVFGLLNIAKSRFGTLDNLPFQEVIKEIAAYRGRAPRTPRQR
jgi:hypothetical protein